MTLADLHLAIARVAAALGLSPDEVTDELSMSLCEPSPGADSGYAATPLNSVLFAWMGCDGCHWVFLELPGRPLHECPVFHVSPMEWEHTCQGENLHDFMEFQCAWSEQCFQDDRGSSGYEPGTRERGLRIIEALRKELGLSPIDDPWARTKPLTARYAKLLVLRPEDFTYRMKIPSESRRIGPDGAGLSCTLLLGGCRAPPAPHPLFSLLLTRVLS